MVVGTWSLKGYLFIVFFDQNRYFSKSRNSEFEIDYSNLFKNIDFDQAIMCCKSSHLCIVFAFNNCTNESTPLLKVAIKIRLCRYSAPEPWLES